MSRAIGLHVVAVDDLVASADDKPIVVAQWVGAGSLRRLLRDRRSLRPGEAITIIAPLVGALSRVHQSGVAIGAVNVDAVHFDASGCPFFTEFGCAQMTVPNPTPVELQLGQNFREDRRQLSSLARNVLAAVSAGAESSHSVSDLNDWLSDDANSASADWGQELEQRLFGIGAPEPLRLIAEVSEEESMTSSTVRMCAAVESPRMAASSSEARVLLALPPWLDGHISDALQLARHQYVRGLRALAAWSRTLRVRTWLLAAIGLICVILSAAILSTETADSGDSAEQSNEVSGRGDTLAPHPPEGTETAETAETAEIPEPRTPTASLNELPADAEHALRLLLDARAACLRDLSVVCLESVSSVGTPAYLSDVALVQAVLAGGEFPTAALFDVEASAKTQQLGDSVLFEFVDGDTSKPASVLLVRGEAGWRIRSYTLPE